MTRLILISAAFGLTLTSGASAMFSLEALTYVPSSWPAKDAFATSAAGRDTAQETAQHPVQDAEQDMITRARMPFSAARFTPVSSPAPRRDR